MGFLADIYVIKKTRSKKLADDFLNNFMPKREESCEQYLIPQYSESPICEFSDSDELMEFLEKNHNYYQSIYFRNTDNNNLNRHGMIFYTEDGYMIFGISRDSYKSQEIENAMNCFELMKKYFRTSEGYITFENPPEHTYENFKKEIYNFNKNRK